MDEPIIDYLKRNLKAAGAAEWPALEAKTGVRASLMRKLAYGDKKRSNPGVKLIQPLVTYFREVEAARQAAETSRAAANKTAKAATIGATAAEQPTAAVQGA